MDLQLTDRKVFISGSTKGIVTNVRTSFTQMCQDIGNPIY
jgi:hypothetical protein